MLGRWLPHRPAAAVAAVASEVAVDLEAIRPEEVSAETLAADSVDEAEEDREEDVEVEEEKKEALSKKSANQRLKVHTVNKLGTCSCIDKLTAASINARLHRSTPLGCIIIAQTTALNNGLHLSPGLILSHVFHGPHAPLFHPPIWIIIARISRRIRSFRSNAREEATRT